MQIVNSGFNCIWPRWKYLKYTITRSFNVFRIQMNIITLKQKQELKGKKNAYSCFLSIKTMETIPCVK